MPKTAKTIPLQQWFDAALAGNRRPPPVSEAPAAARHLERLEMMAPRDSIDWGLLHDGVLCIRHELFIWQDEKNVCHEIINKWDNPQNFGNGPLAEETKRDLRSMVSRFGDKVYNVGMWVCMLAQWRGQDWYGALEAKEKAEIDENVAAGTRFARRVLSIIPLVIDVEREIARVLMQHNSLTLVLAGRRRAVRGPPPELMAWMAEEFE